MKVDLCPIVSVFILTYNNYKEIYETINSVLDQDYPRIELMVGDDGTDHFPLRDVEDYIKVRKRNNIINSVVISKKVNGGTVKNINSLLKISTGEYFFPLSCGDIYNTCDVISEIVRNFRLLNCEVICCRRELVSKKELEPIRYMPSTLYLKKINKIIKRNKTYSAIVLQRFYEMFSGASTYYKKSVFESMGGFDESYRLWEDGPFYAKFLRKGGKIYFIPDLVTIKYRDGGVSKSKNSYMLSDIELFLEKEMLDNLNYLDSLEKRYAMFIWKTTKYRKTKSKVKLVLVYLRYFDAFLQKFYYRGICWLGKNIESYNFKRKKT